MRCRGRPTTEDTSWDTSHPSTMSLLTALGHKDTSFPTSFQYTEHPMDKSHTYIWSDDTRTEVSLCPNAAGRRIVEGVDVSHDLSYDRETRQHVWRAMKPPKETA